MGDGVGWDLPPQPPSEGAVMDARRDQRVTIHDVARRAGVSISTVSHALSGRRPISEETRQRVREAITTLGYRADPSARSLRTRRSGLLGLVLRPRDAATGSLLGAETFNRLSGAVAIETLARKLGLIHVPDILDPSVREVPMDGCLVAHPYRSDEVRAELLRRELPIVTIDEDPDDPGYPWSVNLDYASAMKSLLRGVCGQGVRRPLLVTGTEDNAWNRRTRDAFIDWCPGRGLEPWHASLFEGEGSDNAARLAMHVLDGETPPDVMILATSGFAVAVASVASSLGLRVPGDLRIVALTDTECARNSEVPITAMDLPHERLAAEAVRLLLARISGAESPTEPVVITPEIRLRASSGC